MPITISNKRPDPRTTSGSINSYLRRMRAGDSFFVANDDMVHRPNSVKSQVALFMRTEGKLFSCHLVTEEGKSGLVVYCRSDEALRPIRDVTRKQHRGNSHIHLAQ